MSPEEINILEERLKLAYATAMNLRHTSAGRIEVHLGPNVVEYLKSLTVQPEPLGGWQTAWGFPVVPRDIDDHISVHLVEIIP